MKIKVTVTSPSAEATVVDDLSARAIQARIVQQGIHAVMIDDGEPSVMYVDIGRVLLSGVNDYSALTNLPTVNGKEVKGNLLSDDLKLQPEGDYPEDEITNAEILEILNR